jgi:hypothetical protein
MSFANLQVGSSSINMTNTGFLVTAPGNGGICVNVYAYNSAAQLAKCCSCAVQANQTVNLAISQELGASRSGITSATVELLATPLGGGACNPATITSSQPIPFGLTALKRVAPDGVNVTMETPFAPFILGPVTVSQVASRCANLPAAAQTCTTCTAGAL